MASVSYRREIVFLHFIFFRYSKMPRRGAFTMPFVVFFYHSSLILFYERSAGRLNREYRKNIEEYKGNR